MSSSAPTASTPWRRLDDVEVAALLTDAPVRWWLSGGSAYDRWLGSPIRERDRVTVAIPMAGADDLVAALPENLSAWMPLGDALEPWAGYAEAGDLPAFQVFDAESGSWILQVDLEDGTADRWLYRRDARLQLPWEQAVLDVNGVPTGAPEVQLVWKALRPYPEDEADKDVVLPRLDEEARAWWEKAILRIHPHSTWSIHVRSPLTPAKASWNRPKRPGS